MCADAPRLAQLRFGMLGASRILRMWEFKYSYGQLYMYVQGSLVEVQTATHWNMIGCSMTARPAPPRPAPAFPHRQCYRPAVFRHLRLIALSFPHGKFRRVFRECHIILYTFFFNSDV